MLRVPLQYLSCRQVHQIQRSCMKGATVQNKMPYLDISEYLLKQHSPCFRPKTHDHFQVPSPIQLTPEFSPVMDGITVLIYSPLGRTIKDIGHSTFEFLDFDEFNEFSLEGEINIKNQTKAKKSKKSTLKPNVHSTWHFVDQALQLIIDENDLEFIIVESSNESEDISINEQIQILALNYSDYIEKQQFQQEKQSIKHFDQILCKQPLFLEWQNPNPKKQLINKLKMICSNQQNKTDLEKIQEIQKIIGNYIFDYEKYYFEQSLFQITGDITNVLNTLIKGIEQTFRKTIGGLSFEKRRMKLVKYMEKKKRRVWQKKVNYDCRKKVADGRLRIKGKFVTHEQAREQLGVISLEGYNADEIRIMLEKKYES